jgi:hypothetical protein
MGWRRSHFDQLNDARCNRVPVLIKLVAEFAKVPVVCVKPIPFLFIFEAHDRGRFIDNLLPVSAKTSAHKA